MSERGATPAGGQGAPPEVVTAPRLLGETIVEYPEGARGPAEVVLELVIGVSGDVLEAMAASGEEPFASAALVRAWGWRFEPAESGGKSRAARIRFLVGFTPPPEATDGRDTALGPDAPAPADPAVAPRAAAPAQPIEVTVRSGRKAEPRAQTLTRAEVRQLARRPAAQHAVESGRRVPLA